MAEFSDQELLRYARQIILPSWGIEAQSKLSCSRVLLVGAGGLGCPIGLALCRAGVGAISVVDPDQVELSNLQRQSLFTEAQIGQSKAKAAATELARHNPHVTLKAICASVQSMSLEELAGYDLIVDASDNYATRDWLNRQAFEVKRPLLSSAAIGYDGQLALYDFTRVGQACYRCVFGSGGIDTPCSELGVLSTTTQVIGALAANVALCWLGQGNNTLLNQLMLWSAKSLQTRLISYQSDPRCQICGTPETL